MKRRERRLRGLFNLSERVESFGAIGQAGLDLLKAESEALSGDFRRAARGLGRATVLILLGLFGLFWALGLAAYAAVEVLTIWLPRWGAALAVLGAVLLIAGILAGLGWRLFKSLETPAGTVRRRMREHRDWWEERVAYGSGRVEGADDNPEPTH